MNFEQLLTDRLRIRRLLLKDADVLSHYRSLPLVAKYQSAWSRESALNLIEELLQSTPTTKGHWFQFGIELRDKCELIGDIGFLNTDENGKSWIGFTLDPAHWGKGFATEAANAVLDFYARNKIDSVWASTEPGNELSAKVLYRLDFILFDSTPIDLVFYKKLSR
jgi:RimJ/RimL family protein N-acetyltransferase